MNSDTTLMMSSTHTQKLAQDWMIAHTHIYCPKITYVSDVGPINSSPHKKQYKSFLGKFMDSTTPDFNASMYIPKLKLWSL